MKQILGFFTLSFLILLFFSSCKDEDCVSTANNYLLVNFLDLDTLEEGAINIKAKDTLFYAVKAVGSDSVFYKKAKKVSSLVLPVNPAANQTSFQFTMIDSIRYDTLSFNPIVLDTIFFLHDTPHEISVSYNRKFRVISESCGMEISYQNVTADTNTFSSSALITDYLSRLNTVNIEVYF
ncbi:MAG: DUF6452 family protein [Cyclobacteriaceae bacterium]|nr:DUF6452 family protein [Cyclobacteriaceae bacterium]